MRRPRQTTIVSPGSRMLRRPGLQIDYSRKRNASARLSLLPLSHLLSGTRTRLTLQDMFSTPRRFLQTQQHQIRLSLSSASSSGLTTVTASVDAPLPHSRTCRLAPTIRG
jgi:hypothetical protein